MIMRRRILEAVSEVAQEHARHDNRLREDRRSAYEFIDANLTSDGSISGPVSQLREVLTAADFPYYFGRVLDRAVEARYNYRQGQWRDYTTPMTVLDTTVAERYRFSEFDRPTRRRVKDEPKPGYIYEGRTQYQVYEYAKQIDLEKTMIINDDQGVFQETANLLGDSTRRFRDWYVSALYDNALTQAALVALGANYSGTGRLTTANLMVGWNAFVQRVDGRGNPLNIVPSYLVIPPILRLTANQILQSEFIAELATNGINPIRNSLQIREDPYIAVTPGSANIPWYLFADPGDIPAVRVVSLQDKPRDFYLYAKAPDAVPMSTSMTLGTPDWRDGSFLTGDIEISVVTWIGSRIDDLAGLVGVSDAQGIYYSSGTAP